jgi:hypothetical protein
MYLTGHLWPVSLFPDVQVGIKDPLVGIVLVGDDGRCSTILGMSCKLGEEIRVVIKIITSNSSVNCGESYQAI